MRTVISVAFLMTVSFASFAQDRTIVNDENVCWALKRAVALAGSTIEVKCPKSAEEKDNAKD